LSGHGTLFDDIFFMDQSHDIVNTVSPLLSKKTMLWMKKYDARFGETARQEKCLDIATGELEEDMKPLKIDSWNPKVMGGLG